MHMSEICFAAVSFLYYRFRQTMPKGRSYLQCFYYTLDISYGFLGASGY